MIRAAIALPFAMLALGGCDPAGRIRMPPGVECTVQHLDGLIGKQRSEQTAARAKRLSGARLLRWITPGMLVTMEFRPDRLNLHVDGEGKILSAKCG